MGSTFFGLHIGQTGLYAYQAALDTTAIIYPTRRQRDIADRLWQKQVKRLDEQYLWNGQLC